MESAPGPKGIKIGGQIKVIKDGKKSGPGSSQKKTLIKSRPPTKGKLSTVIRAESSKAIKQSFSAQRLQLQTLKSSLVQNDGSTKPSEMHNELSDRNKRKGLHYNSVGRAANGTASGQKSKMPRTSSFTNS